MDVLLQIKLQLRAVKFGYMYRENPSNNMDSGWRFFEGSETDEYLNNPNNSHIYKLNTICNYDKDIIEFLNAQYGVAYVRDENGNFIEDKQ